VVDPMPGEAPPLLIFADDWGRHPSSCQHITRHLLDRHEVLWVNTIGTRPPRLDLVTLTRGLEKVRHWTRRDDDPASIRRDPAPRVLIPKGWPWFRSRFDRRLNRALLVRHLAPALERLSSPPIAVSTIPIVADLVGALPVERWVYYCVDDFSEWPGLDSKPLRRMEADLVRRADVLIAAGGRLQERLARLGRSSHLLTHGVDLDHWSDIEGAPSPRELEGLPGPLVVFWGVIDRRMDAMFLERLARDMNEGTILLVGPEQSPDPALWRSPRVRRLPPFSYDRLPGLAREAAVLVMPYADLPVTRAMQPLKLLEYLATGRPVVASDLPSTRPWSDALDLAGSPEAFSAAVRWRLATGLPEGQREARRRLGREGWAAKASLFERWIVGPAIERPESDQVDSRLATSPPGTGRGGR
jgi:glycosyltransferase involved in cell wall biosynthesis